MYIVVSTFNNSFDQIWLTYLVPDFLLNSIKLGQIVEIPFRDSIEIWVVLQIKTSLKPSSWWKNEDQMIDLSKIKSIISIYNENIFINSKQIKLIYWLSQNYFTFIHNSLNLFFPVNLREKIIKNKLKFWNQKKINYTFDNHLKLNENQNKSYWEILNSENNKMLLYWLTWSWKTEIYINLINEYIKQDKQVLLLIPEIILNNQIYNRLKKVFWKEILIINSTITAATKTKNRLNIYLNNSKIIIWTRSALFYPYNNLWLIIIDEEHDNSYISDSSPRYNAIEVAEKISELNWNKLLLASWTPSVNSMYKWVKWKYKIVNLLNKYM